MTKTRNIIAAGLSVIVAYLGANVIAINRWAWIFLKGNYPQYRTLLLSSMVFAFVIFGACVRQIRFRNFMLFGICAGYISGLVAFFFLPWSHRPLAKIFSLHDLSINFFWSPIITLSWLVGFLAAVTAWFWMRNMVDSQPSSPASQH